MSRVTARQLGGTVCATLGVGIFLVEIALHVMATVAKGQYELDHMVLILGAVIGFVGFYMLDPTSTKDGSTFMLEEGTSFFSQFKRGGRRATDAPVITEVDTHAPPTDTHPEH